MATESKENRNMLNDERGRGKMVTLRLDSGQIEVVDDTMAEILRHKTPAERIRIGFTLWTSARNMLMTHLKKTHPEWNNDRVEKEVARRLSRGVI
jgi:RNA:NAD 2'-phosphotransferase (TPT1/KptA family)